MKQFAFAVLLTMSLFNCTGQTKPYHFPAVGWTVDIPSDFTITDSSGIQALVDEGGSDLNKAYDSTIKIIPSKILICATKGGSNYFAGSLTAFYPQDGDWMDQYQQIKEITVKTIKSQYHEVIDTLSGTVQIGGLLFNSFSFTNIYPNAMTMYSTMYAILYKGYTFNIFIAYTDKDTGKRIKEIVASSTF